jgi:hypothetical protein
MQILSARRSRWRLTKVISEGVDGDGRHTTTFVGHVSKPVAGGVPWLPCVRLLPSFRIDMLEANQQLTGEMLSLTNSRNGRCARWCAVVVLMAVCSLAIRVATRYSSPETAPASTVKASRCDSSQEQRGRQRLTKDAENWIPPIIVTSALPEPASHLHIVTDGPAIANPSFASVLYYRPPPFSDLLS